MAAILIVSAFVALVAILAEVTIWLQKEPLEEATARAASRMRNLSASPAMNGG